MNKSQALDILGVLPDTTESELKKKYRTLMVMTHPDSVSEHDYPYDVAEINAAYSYLIDHLHEEISAQKEKESSRIRWNAPVNHNAFTERPVYQYYDDKFEAHAGIVNVDTGKYMWIPDEDFPLFLKSLYETARAVIAEDDEKKGINREENTALLADIVYLLAGQFFGSDSAISLMKKTEEENVYFAKAMLEKSYGISIPKNNILVPGRVKDHRLYVTDTKGTTLGYLTFKDDRLLFGIVPLFERRAVQVKMRIENSENSVSGRPVDVGLWIKLIPETGAYIDSINIRIRDMLDK